MDRVEVLAVIGHTILCIVRVFQIDAEVCPRGRDPNVVPFGRIPCPSACIIQATLRFVEGAEDGETVRIFPQGIRTGAASIELVYPLAAFPATTSRLLARFARDLEQLLNQGGKLRGEGVTVATSGCVLLLRLSRVARLAF